MKWEWVVRLPGLTWLVCLAFGHRWRRHGAPAGPFDSSGFARRGEWAWVEPFRCRRCGLVILRRIGEG